MHFRFRKLATNAIFLTCVGAAFFAGVQTPRAASESLEDRVSALRKVGARYLGRVYPGEMPVKNAEAKNLATPTKKTDEEVIWTSLDEFAAPRSVHSEWATLLEREVPDLRRENVQMYPFVTGQHVDHPGDGKIEELDANGYVVEQTVIGTMRDGKPYRVRICHLFFVKDGVIVRDNQYWSGADAASLALTNRTLGMTRGEYQRHAESKTR